MAPLVSVPADFGRHHIGAPSHGNLAFNLQEGPQIKANSIIMSLNSPVIDKLTTDLHQTSLDAQDFSREAVDCFIESSYTGEVDALNLGNFGDVYKMSSVFKVSWLVARCEEFFVSHLEGLSNESTYSDMLFAVKEAVFSLSALKKTDFLNFVVKKMKKISNTKRDSFICKYLTDLSQCTSHQIDACVAIVDTDVHVLAKLLIAYLENGEKVTLDKNSRYLFENLNLSFCNDEIRSSLFSVMESIQHADQQDFKLILRKLREKTAQRQTPDSQTGAGISAAQRQVPEQTGAGISAAQGQVPEQTGISAPEQSGAGIPAIKTVSIAPYLEISPLSSFINGLISDEIVDNLYELIDGIWLKLRQHKDQFPGENTIKQLIKIKLKKGWRAIDHEYVSKMFTSKTGATIFQCTKFLELLKKSDGLVSKRPQKSYALTQAYTGPEFIREIFEKDNTIPLLMNSPGYYDLHINDLLTTATKGNDIDSFSIKWGEVKRKMPKLHLALQRWRADKWSNLPLTWCGKPSFEPTRTTWNWGHIWFGEGRPVTLDDYNSLVKGKDDPIFWSPCIGVFRDCKYRLVAFVV